MIISTADKLPIKTDQLNLEDETDSVDGSAIGVNHVRIDPGGDIDRHGHHNVSHITESLCSDTPGYPLLCSTRFYTGIMGFMACVIMMVFRVNMSVTIVAMTNHTALSIEARKSICVNIIDDIVANISIRDKEMPRIVSNESSITQLQSILNPVSDNGPFVWSKQLQGLILSSGAWGFLVGQMPLGLLAKRAGARSTLAVSVLLCSAANALMPIAAYLHVIALIALRIFAGAFQGAIQPSIYLLIGVWSVPNERSRLVGLSLTGVKIGGLITLPLTGLLCKFGFANGWPSVFYCSAIVGTIFAIIWLASIYNSPMTHPRVNPKEKEFIHSRLGCQAFDSEKNIPWKSILSSFPVWAITIAQTSACVGTIIYIYFIPSFTNDVLNFGIAFNGVISTIPLIGEWLMLILSSVTADRLITRKSLTVTRCRKIFTAIGTFLPSLFLFLLANIDCSTSPSLIVFLLTMTVTFSGCIFGGGIMINHTDIAPRHAGVIFAFCNTLAMLIASLVPLIIGTLTSSGTLSGWHHVFYMLAGVYVFGGGFYCIAGSGMLQPWAIDHVHSNTENKEEEDQQLATLVDHNNTSMHPDKDTVNTHNGVNKTVS